MIEYALLAGLQAGEKLFFDGLSANFDQST
ncbi:hypothetical protein SAMN05661091_6123 [Paenibacillus uliginis N3/975]|uniref:Uncharacterized protein n=1 Tax=Paenibacillus uliginis N3/975 TaxID=1313296 RepID=A0A1X7HTV7_9BACL|nr:hypothetical protein SAMN05661091_6123 [Paenibacillus uliginis N3/975]